MRRKLAAGNWKMNGTSDMLVELETLSNTPSTEGCDVLICPPSTLISRARACANANIMIGAQDCHVNKSGAHTGDISAPMLQDAGASHVILGHSERREDHAESSQDVHDKAVGAISAGLKVVICIGESLSQREANITLKIIADQLASSISDQVTAENLVVAYEPIWAIGTGKVPTLDQIAEVHDFIRTKLELRFGKDIGGSISLLYGGSVKPANASEIFAVSNVDGALVGGASLKAQDFVPIITALQNA